MEFQGRWEYHGPAWMREREDQKAGVKSRDKWAYTTNARLAEIKESPQQMRGQFQRKERSDWAWAAKGLAVSGNSYPKRQSKLRRTAGFGPYRREQRRGKGESKGRQSPFFCLGFYKLILEALDANSCETGVQCQRKRQRGAKRESPHLEAFNVSCISLVSRSCEVSQGVAAKPVKRRVPAHGC